MKHSILLQTATNASQLSRLTWVLRWQCVIPEQLQWEALPDGAACVRVVVECDDWRLRRLLVHWKRIVGVKVVAAVTLEEGNPAAPDGHLVPTAR